MNNRRGQMRWHQITQKLSLSGLTASPGQFLERTFLTAFILCTSLSFASHCPDLRLRQATIGGDAITGYVILRNGPLKSAQMRLYDSSGKTAWVGLTDKHGGFSITHLRPDTYRLEVSGWGTAKIRLNPELDKLSTGQVPVWGVELMDNECVGSSQSVD
jgi:hypothetical protein